jgi:hypothetical protein
MSIERKNQAIGQKGVTQTFLSILQEDGFFTLFRGSFSDWFSFFIHFVMSDARHLMQGSFPV